MENNINKNMEIMKKIIEEKKAKFSQQKNTKRPSIYRRQSPGAGNIE